MTIYTRTFLILFALFWEIHNVSAQQSTRLNTGWSYLKGDLGGIWEAVRPVANGAPESFPIWENVTLPHCFNALDAVDPAGNYYRGPGWYRSFLEVNNPYPQGRTLLHFEGAGQKTDVYVNQTKVGSHVGGYDEWWVDITDAVAEFRKTGAFQNQAGGKIPIAIRCDNTRDLEMIPSGLSDFNIYGGLYRYVNRVYMPALYAPTILANAATDPTGQKGTLTVSVRLANPTNVSAITATVQLFDPQGKAIQQLKKTITNGAGTVVLGRITVDKPQGWSTDKPTLYTVDVTLASSAGTFRQSEKVGFRHIDFVNKGPFKLNGQRLLLRGTHRHEDHAGVAAAMTEDMIRAEMVLMKQMGVNFIRLGHYQQSRIVLNLCDSLGILVWEEIPWCRGGLGGDVYKTQSRRMLTNMIEQHYNHPAVIIWGLGNENDWPGDFPEFDKLKIRAFMTELNDLAHQLDPGRKTAIRRCDFCKDIVDVYSPSIWAGWYRGRYTEYKAVTEKEMAGVNHFLHVEWGGDSHARRHSEDPDQATLNIMTGKGADERAGDASRSGGDARISKDGDWSETYICNLIDWHLKEQETMPTLTGTAYWPFKDFSTPIRPENPVPYVNQKGVVERDFTPKESYYVFQSYWTKPLMAHIYGHSWPVRWGKKGEEKLIKVYSNGTEAELFLNGKSYGTKKRNSADFPAAGLRWVVPFREGENQVRVVARQGTTTAEDQLTVHYQTATWSKPTRLLVEKIDEQAGIVAVQVRAVDDQQVACLDAINVVNFSLVGDGKLIDNQGTSTGSRVVQLYNGRALIRVQTNNGRSVVSVQSPDLPTAFVDLSTTTRTPPQPLPLK
ncbi:glycoside hydrolase family 2 protein [Spirosoma jeollabukense]